MDATRFDRLARSVGARASRRQALVGLLAGLGTAMVTLPRTDVVGAKADGGKSSRLRAQKRRKKDPGDPLARLRDCPHPGPGQNLSKCNFVGKDLRGTTLSGSNLSGANFTFANLCSANLGGANLNKTDFTGAVLTRADFRGTKLSKAILAHAVLCQTRLPDGALENRGCPPDGEDVCCDDAECDDSTPCDRGVCGGPPPGDTCVAMGAICSLPFGNACCRYGGSGSCKPTAALLLTTCQVPCESDANCRDILGSPDVICFSHASCLPFQKCCHRQVTVHPEKDCSTGKACALFNPGLYECCLPGETCSVPLAGCG